MPTRQELLHKRLTEEGNKLVAFLEGLSPAQRTQAIYDERGVWTIKDILAHQVSAERAYHVLVDDLLAGGRGSPEGFSIDDYNSQEVARMASVPWDELVEALRAVRAESAALASRLTDEQLDCEGRHPFLGVASIWDILQLIYRHNMMHMRDMRRALGDGKL